jgi:predicted lipoprotein with Yx(FWY)xxD motif
MTTRILALAAALAMLSGAALAAEAPAKPMTTPLGSVLATPQGMTLYTFDKDTVGMSACTGPCAENWPPFKAPADAMAHDAWTVVTRDDGARQWAYKGKPLYTWAKDMKPGDTTGEGVKDVWHAARP